MPKSNNSFIDENHSDLLLHLSGITGKYSEAKQVDRSEFSTEMGHFCANIENHFNHEKSFCREPVLINWMNIGFNTEKFQWLSGN